jgi:Protein of unknown function (DUF3987)
MSNNQDKSWLKRWGLELVNMPQEIKENLLWGVSTMSVLDARTGRVDKSPRNPHTGQRLSVTDPTGWVTFDEAMNSGYPAKGVLLRAEDPYVVIDLDKSNDEKVKNFSRQIYDNFDSYAERSYSGKGVHIILRGPNEVGRRKGNVEIYSQERYIICTGQILKNQPIIDGGETLFNLRASLDASDNPDALPQVEDEQESESDTQILQKMFNAANGHSVQELYETKPTGSDDWSNLDSKLAQHICFYTRNRNQALRLFRGSALYRGYDSEHKKNGYERADKYEEDYLVRRTFARAWHLISAREIEAAKKREYTDKLINNSLDAMIANAKHAKTVDSLDLPIPTRAETRAMIAEKVDLETSGAVPDKILIDPVTGEVIVQTHKTFVSKFSKVERPTGLLGEITDFIMATAPRPVFEIALAGAINFLSGVAGRHYNINGTGLGLYTVLLADTGRGKEAASNGIGALTDAVSKQAPVITDFWGPSQIASGQGLIRTMADETIIPSRFMFLSEFGHMMQIITSRDATGADMKTRQVLLDMFSKSGWGSVIKESAYADKSNNTKAVYSPNLSIMGDTTPEMLFSNMSDKLISEGFLPRFLFIEYDGPRTPPNMAVNRIPSEDLVTRCVTLVHQIMSLKQANQCVNITMNDGASAILDNFSRFCDYKIENLKKTPMSEMWNRAHLMALRIAGVLAVGNNAFEPVVTEADAHWAQSLILRSLETIDLRIENGEFGQTDAGLRRTVRSIVKDYFETDVAGKKARHLKGRWLTYKENKVIPHKYLVEKTEKMSKFVNNATGHSRLLQSVLTDLVRQGDLTEFDIRMLDQPDKRIKNMEQSYLLGPNFYDNYRSADSEVTNE